jgi:predicted metal-dependent phosphoesterase TrpH
MSADLHIHTTASDGRLSPEQVYESAIIAGLRTIAITDHDTTAGNVKLQKMLRTTITPPRLKVINGIEMSCDYPEHEVHILGYHIDVDNPQLNDQLRCILDDRISTAPSILRVNSSLSLFRLHHTIHDSSKGLTISAHSAERSSTVSRRACCRS